MFENKSKQGRPRHLRLADPAEHPPDIQEQRDLDLAARISRIKFSIQRINELMKELKENEKGKSRE